MWKLYISKNFSPVFCFQDIQLRRVDSETPAIQKCWTTVHERDVVAYTDKKLKIEWKK